MPTALVTGAGVRIGRAIALTLADAGWDLLLHAHRSSQQLESLAKDLRTNGRVITTLSADLGQESGQAQLIDLVIQSGLGLDAIVHNAAIFHGVQFQDISRKQFRDMMALNCEAPFFLTQGLFPLLQKSANACLVHITDALADRPFPRYAHYFTSKSAMLGLTRALAVELAPHIRVNAVGLGAILFPSDYEPEKQARIVSRIPFKKAGTPQDAAKAVLFLLQEAPYITGQVISVDGGWSVSS